jgi:hypothetical protein
MNMVWHLLGHPVVAIFLTILVTAFALTGKPNLALSKLFFFAAWCVGMIAVFHTDILPSLLWQVIAAVLTTLVLVGFGFWSSASDSPTITIDRFYCEKATFKFRPEMQWWALHLKLQSNKSVDVVAKITFYNADAPKPQYLFHFYGRWADGHYPTATTPKAMITPTTFPAKFPRDLDICLKYPADTDCFGINNESIEASPNDFKLDQYRLTGVHFLAEVQLQPSFKEKAFRLWFKNEGAGGGITNLRYSLVRWFTRSLVSA